VLLGLGLGAGMMGAGYLLASSQKDKRLPPSVPHEAGEKRKAEPCKIIEHDGQRMRSMSDAVWESNDTSNTRIVNMRNCISPAVLCEEISSEDPVVRDTVLMGRSSVSSIVQGLDDRLICIVGPCSIHDPKAAMEYAVKLADAAEKHVEDLCIVMRVYFEKPRTTVGWKGLINDPSLDGSYNINRGLRLARTVLSDINSLGLPCGTEFLDTISPQYTADLITWGAIGARTTESQIHRELASGLSMPIGFKNGTNGDCQIAADAIKAAEYPHCFLSVTSQGQVAIVKTSGNADGHLILRGGASGPNYDKDSISAATELLKKNKCLEKIVVDCSHGNSKKIHTNQPIVAKDVAEQIAKGNKGVCGVMLESNLVAGAQKEPLKNGGKPLTYGQSITDACIDWETTVGVLDDLAAGVRARRETV